MEPICSQVTRSMTRWAGHEGHARITIQKIANYKHGIVRLLQETTIRREGYLNLHQPIPISRVCFAVLAQAASSEKIGFAHPRVKKLG